MNLSGGRGKGGGRGGDGRKGGLNILALNLYLVMVDCLAASVYFKGQSEAYKLTEFAVRKIHSVAETFLSLVGSEATEEKDLMVKVCLIRVVLH